MKVIIAGGTEIELGTTEAAPTIGIVDYSRRVTDDFGVTTVVQRGFARRMTVRLMLPFDSVDALQRRLAGLRATPATWVADDRFDSLTMEGFYKDFSIDLAVPPNSFCTLTIESLTETGDFTDSGIDPAPDSLPSTLRLLQPIVVTSATMTGSNVPETDHPAWAVGTTYALGARVIKTATHRIYESAAAGNVGNDPAGTSGKWLDVGPTNRWAMFDQALGTITTHSSSMTVTVDPVTSINAVALLDVDAASVRVRAAGYDRTLVPAARPGMVTFLDLPPTSGTVTFTITGTGAISVGTLLLGQLVGLGITEASPTAAITDYSRKDVDEFGVVTVVERAWAKRMNVRALLRTDAIDTVAGRIAAVRAQPSLWIGQDGLESVTVYGFFKDFAIEVGEDVSTLSLSIEGLSAAAQLAPLVGDVGWSDVKDDDPAHPKPEDGATRGALPLEKLSIDLNTTHIIEQALRQDDAQQILDARTFVEGQPVSTKFLEFRNSQESANEAAAAQVALIGAATPDGTAFVLDVDRVKVTADKSLAQKFDETGAANELTDARVTLLREAIVSPAGGAQARAMLKAEAGGRLAGIVLIAEDGTTTELSEINLVAGVTRIMKEDGTVLSTFGYEGDKVYIPNLMADTLTLTAMDPVFIDKQVEAASEITQELPGGFIIKTGQYRGLIDDEAQFSITFQTPFPTYCMALIPVPYLNSYSHLRDLWLQRVGPLTRFGGAVGTQSSTRNSQQIDGFDWVAFGM